MRLPILLLALNLASPALGQDFSCRIGTQPACLDYGDQVCSSRGMCVDKNATCFNSNQCNYEGFTCKSNVTECVEAHDALLQKHNKLVDDFNENLEIAKKMAARLSFAIVAWSTHVSLTIYDGSKNYGHQTGQLKLWVDRRTIWSALVDTSGSMIFINSPKGDIYIDIQRGRQLYIDLDNDNMAEYRFSLDGSAAALPVLVDCINKIGGLRG